MNLFNIAVISGDKMLRAISYNVIVPEDDAPTVIVSAFAITECVSLMLSDKSILYLTSLVDVIELNM